MTQEKTGNILLGLLLGIALPVLFMWVYTNNFYPGANSLKEVVSALYPGALLGKLTLLSLTPDLIVAFIFYKFDKFKWGGGVILGAIPYLIFSIYMFN